MLEDYERIKAAVAKRLAAADHAEEVQGVAVLMLFEASPDGAVKSANDARAKRTSRRAPAQR